MNLSPGGKPESGFRGQWTVLVAALLGWLFDGFEMGLFPVVARPALKSMLPGIAEQDVGRWMGIITAMFLIGAAIGGLVFGWLGDRFGRVRAMSLSILAYSLFTGVVYFAQSPAQVGGCRFLAGLGMGGEWSLGVALVMECWPDRWRPLLAGVIGAAANIGFLLVGFTAKAFPVTEESWRWMFLVGTLPALLVFFIRLFVPESKRWKSSVEERAARPIRELFEGGLKKNTLLAIALSSIALIGTWGAVEWLPLWADQMTGGTNPGAKATTIMTRSFGSIFGCILGPLVGALLGRRPAFSLLCLAAFCLCSILFRTIENYDRTFLVMVFFVGAASTSFYGWFSLYLPELFPTRVRATGQGVSYNTGRVFAAAGALTAGQLIQYFEGSYARQGATISTIYLLGILIIWFAPETRGKPLPK